MLMAGSSCSDSSAPSAKPKESSPATSLPVECQSITNPADVKSLPTDCANAIFVKRIQDEGSAELKKLDKDKLISLGNAVCTFAAVIRDSGPVTTPYSELVAANAKNWGVSEKAVMEITGSSGVLCPDDIDNVIRLQGSVGSVSVDYSAWGPGELKISYTGTDGNLVTRTTHTPWDYRILLTEAGAVTLKVEMAEDGEGDPACEIRVNRKKIASAKAKDGVALCSADSQAIAGAAG